MKGVILAGGKGTRLYPLTKITNKHLLPVGKEPMIFNPIRQMVLAGIEEILIVTSIENMGEVVRLLGSGKAFGCRFTYKVQEEPRGIADALALAEDFSNNEPITVILGDNIATHSIKPYVEKFKKTPFGAKIFLKEVAEPQHYGIAALDEKKIISIKEKPNKVENDFFAVIGIYIYDNTVFEKIKKIQPSERGELEITSVNNLYLSEENLSYEILKGKWTDAGTFESYHYANKILFETDNKIIENSGE